MTLKERRYDLDWLRVISVFAVFLHHVLMPFNGDNFHIMNVDHSKFLDDIMVYFEQFRLPLLFFISGVGTAFAFSKRSWKGFIIERARRLLIPLIFGVVVLIPPQVYYEKIFEFTSFREAYITILFKLEVNHLWFLENLFLISLLLIPFILYIRSIKSLKIKSYIEVFTLRYGFSAWVIFLLILRIITKDFFPSNSKDFFNPSESLYFGFFFISGIVIARNRKLWEIILTNRRKNLLLFFISTIMFYLYYFFPGEYLKPNISIVNRWRLWYFFCTLLTWFFICTSLGYSQEYLNKKSNILKKLNEAVYPFYILHQTVIIMIGYYIIKLNISLLMKITILFTSSLVVIVIVYYLLIYNFRVIRFLFGMKREKLKK